MSKMLQLILEEENKLITNAKEFYGESFLISQDVLYLFYDLFTDNPDAKSAIFFKFHYTTYKALYLAFLSTIRKHLVQSHYNIRYALEATMRGIYGLFDQDLTKYGNFDDIEAIESDNKNNVFGKWCMENFPKETEGLFNLQRKLSATYIHPNLNNTNLNSTLGIESGLINAHFFDRISDGELKGQLLGLIFIMIDLLKIELLAIKKYPLVSVKKSIIPRLNELHEQTVSYRGILISKGELKFK